MKFHRDRAEQGCLPLSMAIIPGKTFHDEPSSLTTLHITERCAECPWPAVCEQDVTCWELDRGQGWARSKVDLPRTGLKGRNTQ